MSRNNNLDEIDEEEALPDGEIDEVDELEGYRELGDDLEEEDDTDDTDTDEGATADEKVTEVEEEPTPDLDEDDDTEEEESLEALLGTDEPATEASPRVAGARAPEGIGEDEFTCRSCFLVKSRAQLADVDTLVCTDCA